MAEVNVGSHCGMTDCRQLDFLPIKCSRCGIIFCKLHAAYDNHSCPKFNITLEDPSDGRSAAITFPCHFEQCSDREQTEVVCHDCARTFCLQHRHAQDHECPSMPVAQPQQRMTSTRDHVQKIIAEKASVKKAKPLSKKACATAAKVQLMKIKMKAVGKKGIPEDDQFFLAVRMPLKCKEREKALCFSSKWAVGRAIDHAASISCIENKNNVAAAQKLCMFSARSGLPLPIERTLQALAEDEQFFLLSGSTVVMEYAKDFSCSSVDLTLYK